MPIPTTVVVSAIVRNPRREFLLIQHPVRGWEPPGGRIELGEDLGASLVREVLEETGLTICVGALMAVYQNIGEHSSLIFAFSGEPAGGELRTSEESLAVGWFTADQALQSISGPGTLRRFQDLLMLEAGQIRYHSFTSAGHHTAAEYVIHTHRIL